MEADQFQMSLFAALHRFSPVHMNDFGDLTKVEFFTLAILHRHQMEQPDGKGMYVSALARQMRCSPPAASRTLRNLEHKALLDRVVDREDRRNTHIVLTEQGSSVMEQNWARLQTVSGRVVARMGAETITALIAQLNLLADIITDEQKRSNNHVEHP